MYITKSKIIEPKAEKTSKKPKVPTLFSKLNVMLEGGLTNELVLVLAPSSGGKSIVLDSWAWHLSNKLSPGLWSYMFLLEQHSETRIKRIMCNELGIKLSELNKQTVEVPDRNLFIVDTKDLISSTIEGIDTFLESRSEKPGVIFIDYPGASDGVLGGDHRQYEVMAKKMERLALKYEVPVIFGHQANTPEFFDKNNDYYGEQNVADAKKIIRPCRLCFSINQSEVQDNMNQGTINIFKFSEGQKTHFDVYFNKSTFTVKDLNNANSEIQKESSAIETGFNCIKFTK